MKKRYFLVGFEYSYREATSNVLNPHVSTFGTHSYGFDTEKFPTKTELESNCKGYLEKMYPDLKEKQLVSLTISSFSELSEQDYKTLFEIK